MARVRASLQSGLALWTMLRRTWAELALTARDRGNRRAAASAERELIRCEVECLCYEEQLAMLGHERASALKEGRDGDRV
jgi:hypothetical protein